MQPTQRCPEVGVRIRFRQNGAHLVECLTDIDVLTPGSVKCCDGGRPAMSSNTMHKHRVAFGPELLDGTDGIEQGEVEIGVRTLLIDEPHIEDIYLETIGAAETSSELPT